MAGEIVLKKKEEQAEKKANRPAAGEGRLAVNAKRLILAGTLMALFTPLVVLGGILNPFNSPKALLFMAAVQFIFYIWLFLAFHRPQYRPELNPVLLLLAAYTAALTLSTIFGADPVASFWSEHGRLTGLLFQLHLFAFFLVLSSVFKSEGEWRFLIGTAVAIAVLVSLWGLADNFGLEWVIRVYDSAGIVSEQARTLSGGASTFGNTSFLGTYLLFNAFFALFLFAGSAWQGRIPWALAFLLIAAGLLLNPGGRAMKGAFIAGLIIAGLLYLAFCHRRRPVMVAARVFLGAALISGLFFGLTAFWEGSFAQRQVFSLQGMPGRMINWQSAWQGFLERPLLGWGPENFEIALQRHIDPRVMLPGWGFVAEAWHDRAHNVVFEHLVTTGLLGTILYFALIAWALLVLWQAWLGEKGPGFWTPALFTALFAAHFIQNLTVFDMPASHILFYLALAYMAHIATAGAEGQAVRKKGKAIKPGLLSLPLLILLAALMALSFNHFVSRPFQAGRVVRLILEDPADSSLADVAQTANALTPMGRQHIRYLLGAATVIRLEQVIGRQAEIELIGRLRGYPLRSAHVDENARMAALLLSDMEQMIIEAKISIEETPLNYRLYYDLGQLNKAYSSALSSFASGREEMLQEALPAALAAEEAYRQAIAISPTNVEAYWGLAEAVIMQGELIDSPERFREALAISEAVIKIEPRFKKSHALGLRAASLLQDEALVFEKYNQALAIFPDWGKDLVLLSGRDPVWWTPLYLEYF